MRQLLIESSADKDEIALIQDRQLIDFWRFRKESIEAEQIYLGVVERVVKGMNAAFVRLTKDDNGFLPLSEARQPLKGGDTLLVQVKKPPVQSKAAYLTQDISLAAEELILLPLSQNCSVSKKIENDAVRKRLTSLARQIAPEHMGLVMRHGCEEFSEDRLKAVADELKARWTLISEKAKASRPPCLIEAAPAPLMHVLRDNAPVDSIVANSSGIRAITADMTIPVQVSDSPFSLFNVAAQLKKATARRVWLKSGGFLVVDPCEALTVIDVNTGKFVGDGKSGEESTFLTLNREAAREIARLLRLRAIGGIVIIDFIDMKDESSRELILSDMKELIKSDPVKCVVHGFTTLGLLELTRKKTAEALTSETENFLCPHCHGTGIRQEEDENAGTNP